MKQSSFVFILIAFITISLCSYGQGMSLEPGKTIEKKMLKVESHVYTITLSKGEYMSCTVVQKGVDLAIDVIDPLGKKVKTFDSPNGKEGPEPVSIEALQAGKYELHIYPGADNEETTDLAKVAPAGDQGSYTITDVVKFTANEYKQKLGAAKKGKEQFVQWITANAHPLKTVDAGNGFEDLEPFRQILNGVQVVGLGEASHGTSEFFRMKHRMLEFLVKENGFTSFYIEASMTRCRYINDYVLYGKGNLDTATAIQGFVTWRVEEVKNMIEWMRLYNATVADERKVKFFGYDLQINDHGWSGLREFYSKANPEKLPHLDSLKIQLDTASALSNTFNRKNEGAKLFKMLYQQCVEVMTDITLNEGRYKYQLGPEAYNENLMNIKLIVQEAEVYRGEWSDRRDYYMAQNILQLLNNEKPGAKVVVWAHNGHIEKNVMPGFSSMGACLAKTLKDKYYAVGFEFYSGSFQTRNADINNRSKNWDVMTVGPPPRESLPWYFDKAGKTKFFIDFRNTGADKIYNFPQAYAMHGFGSMYSTKWPATNEDYLSNFDGMIYIKESTAAKNLTKVYLR